MPLEIELATLIYYYAKHDMEIDDEFVSRVVNAVVESRELYKYVHGFYWCTEILAAYDYFNQLIYVNRDIFLRMKDIERNTDLTSLTSCERNMYAYMLAVKSILHELEHAAQYKKVDNLDDQSLETTLLRIETDFIRNASYMELRAYQTVEYKKFYKYNPTERMADAKAWRLLREGFSNSIEGRRLGGCAAWYESSTMFDAYLDSMKENKCPTEIYLEGNGLTDLLEKLGFCDEKSKQILEYSKNYNLPTRLELGLPISNEEYHCVRKIHCK